MKCYGCGDEGHIEPNCPNAVFDATGKPPWCGICDERTRLLGLDEVHRCPVCHPQRNAQLRQHRKCPRCHMTVYEWDNEPCGDHASPVAPDRRPDRETIDSLAPVADLKGQLEQARRAAQEPRDAA